MTSEECWILEAEKAGLKLWKPCSSVWAWLTAEPVEAGYWDLEVADDTEDTREDLQHHRTGDR